MPATRRATLALGYFQRRLKRRVAVLLIRSRHSCCLSLRPGVSFRSLALS
jgi:hypothetical protein